MAVLIEASSVVVRNSTIAAKYPGGMAGYVQNCPNASICSDEHLSRIGFMMQGDADLFVARLAADGFTPYRNNAAEDVALISQSAGLLLPCDWLELGWYERAAIAWLAGWEVGDLHAPSGWDLGRPLQFMSAEEAKERLEFVRTQDDLEVYRDKATGQEHYVGRTDHPSDGDTSRHNPLYERACARIEGLILLNGQSPGELDADSRRRLVDAIVLFLDVVDINPGNWAAMWCLGKTYQRLEDYERGLQWFSRAHRVNPDQPDVAREAAIAAMELGRPDEAIRFCQRAIEVKPDDAGPRANLALALLFSGKPDEARGIAADSLHLDPADEITAHILQIIDEVLGGTRDCPHHVRDLG